MTESIKVTGLAELTRAFGRIDKSLKKELTDELRVIVRVLRDSARSEAASKGLSSPGLSGRGTGGLIKGLSYSVRGARAYLTDKTTRNGFPYPAVYEFGHGGARAFLQPTLEHNRPEIILALERMLDHVTNEFGGI